MNQQTLEKLEYMRIKEQLMTYAMSYLGREHVLRMKPLTNLRQIERLLSEADEAKAVVSGGTSVPIPTMNGIETVMSRLDKGMALTENDVTSVSQFLRSTEQLKHFMGRKVEIAPRVSSYALALDELNDVRSELERCVPNGSVVDEASEGLTRIRKKLRILEERQRKKVDGLVAKYRTYLQEHVVANRGGRAVLPVKREHKRLVPGVVVDQSGSGQTLFIEPADLAPIQQELAESKALETLEVSLILDGLTGYVAERRPTIEANIEIIGHYDFLFAKAKLARSLDARSVKLNTEGRVSIVEGRHPLLTVRSVPLNFTIGDDYRVLVITGPNTGGKTVSLKTVGLLTLMVQSGLLVPVGQGSEFAVFEDVLADIGDGQSIDQSLSTFSSHVKNVIDILGRTAKQTLVLMDELATGTDPGEGIGLSIAVLEELFHRGATIVATTHFNEIKEFAKVTKGFENARMEFNLETLEPMYQLKIGEAGSSYAFEIALKLGMPENVIHRSRQITGRQPREFVPVPDGGGRGMTPGGRHRSAARKRPDPSHKKTLQIGDRVWIHSLKKSGIVYSLQDERGMMTVVVQKQKMEINVKRVSLYLRREELYPEDYDLDIVLESKQDRKARKAMSKLHVEGLSIEHGADERTTRPLEGRDRT